MTFTANDLRALQGEPASTEVERFLLMLRRKGRARMELAAEIRAAGDVVVAFGGRYVVQRS